jgi:protein-disulfide isomerase-like protein with CxxC motif
LAYHYGNSVELDHVMGGMIEDIKTYNNRRLAIGGDIALSNRKIHDHWLEASAVHGMPVCEHGFHLFSQEHPSTIPQNLAYLAARVYEARYGNEVKPGAARHYLRHLQEATAVDAVVTNDADVLVDMSAVVGFVPEKFRTIFSSDVVKTLYDEGRAFCRNYEVTSFPCYLVTYRGEEMMLRGYSSFDVVRNCIEQLSFGNIKPIDDGREKFTAENVLRFMENYGSAYPVEIATAFGLARHNGHTALNVESYEGLPDMMEQLVKAGEVATAPRGNGFICYRLNGKVPKEHIYGHKYESAGA